MSTITQHGYLILADITGYTSYLAGVELDHAHEILTDLLAVIVGKFRPVLTIAKLEGDAVFAYVPEAKVRRGETLLELIDATYGAFHERIRSSGRHTTCQCRACQSMPGLDLKFFIHHGDYIVQEVMGIHELVGSDVNLVHRMLKNHVTESTGWKAYAMLTARALDHIGVRQANLFEQAETYEHLGTTITFSYELRQRYEDSLKARRVLVAPADAMAVLTRDFSVPAPILWEWLNDPTKRALYAGQSGLTFRPVRVPNGRRGVGAQTHCMHGENAAMREVVLDWRPFDYFTVNQDSGFPYGNMLYTYRLEPLGSGDATKLTISMKGTVLPGPFNAPLVRLIYGRYFMPLLTKQLAARIDESRSAAGMGFEKSPEPVALHVR